MKAQHWVNQPERGNLFFLRLTRYLVKYVPLPVMKGITLCIVIYFYFTSTKTRRNLERYQQRLTATFPQLTLPKYAIFRQFICFADALIDRFSVWQNKMTSHLVIDDKDNIFQHIRCNKGRGQLLICSHLGNMEICRALSRRHKHFRLNVLVHNHNTATFNQVLEEAGAAELKTIQIEDLTLDVMLELNRRIERGEWIAIAADRVPIQGSKTQKVQFLGKETDFPQGVWLLASLLKTPINTAFCLKQNKCNYLKLRRFSHPIDAQSNERQQMIKQIMQHYADLLAKECAENPLLWFNFYDFWSDEIETN